MYAYQHPNSMTAYQPKPMSITEIIPAMRTLLNGRIWCTPSMSASLPFKHVLIVLYRNIYLTNMDKTLRRRVSQLPIHIQSS